MTIRTIGFGAKIKYLIEEPCNLKLAKVIHRLHLNDTEIHLAKPSAGREQKDVYSTYCRLCTDAEDRK